MADAAPFIVSWNVTRVCNLACGHCYLDAVQRRKEAPDELDATEALGVVDQIAEVAPGAMLVLTGGEPLLRRDLAALVGRATRRGLMPVVGTNGIALTPARASELAAAGAAGVGISLDSASAAFHDRLRGMSGAWEGARRGMRAARDAGLGVLVQTTLFAENRLEIDALADVCEAEGAMALNFFFLVCVGRGVTQTDLSGDKYEEALAGIAQLQVRRPGLMVRARCAPYLRRMLALGAGERRDGFAEWSSACLAGQSYFRITPTGAVTPCPYIPGAVGDLRRERLADVWGKHPVLRELREGTPSGKCGGCDFRYSCGGCRARAAAHSGDLMGEDPKCGYVVPLGAAPETRPVHRRPALAWDPAAVQLLERIPAFIRERVRTAVEQRALREGVSPVTVDYMRRHRPPAAVVGRFVRTS